MFILHFDTLMWHTGVRNNPKATLPLCHIAYIIDYIIVVYLLYSLCICYIGNFELAQPCLNFIFSPSATFPAREPCSSSLRVIQN